MWYRSRQTPWHRRELLNKALTLFDTVKKHCNSTFKIWSYLRLSTDQYDQLNLMEKIQDQQPLTSEYYSDWQPSLFRSLCKNNTRIDRRVLFSHSRASSSCEQTGAALRPSPHAASTEPLTGQSLVTNHFAKAGVFNHLCDLWSCLKTHSLVPIRLGEAVSKEQDEQLALAPRPELPHCDAIQL